MKTTRLEDIEPWKASLRLSRQIYKITVSTGFRRNAELKSQLRGAADSVTANIAEGFGAGGVEAFMSFLGTAQGSAAQVQSHLRFALEHGHITPGEFNWLDGSAEDVKKVIEDYARRLSGPASDAAKTGD